MDKNLEALKALYVAVGGDADDVADMTTNAEVIGAIASVFVPLPAIAAKDAGKVLKVSDEGEWELADDETTQAVG